MTKLRNLPPMIARQAPLVSTSVPKVADPHYLTPEHRAWRAAVIARAGGRCQSPTCQGRAPTARLFADHVRELRDGGAPLDLANGQALCGTCHARKTASARARRMATPPAMR